MAEVAMIALMSVMRTTEPGKAATKDRKAVPPKTVEVPKGKPFDAKDEDEAAELEGMGAAVRAAATDDTSKRKVNSTKPSAVKQDTKKAEKGLEGDDRLSHFKEAIRALPEDGFGADGKPKVANVNDSTPKGTKAMTGKERDAIWAELQDESEGGNDASTDLV